MTTAVRDIERQRRHRGRLVRHGLRPRRPDQGLQGRSRPRRHPAEYVAADPADGWRRLHLNTRAWPTTSASRPARGRARSRRPRPVLGTWTAAVDEHLRRPHPEPRPGQLHRGTGEFADSRSRLTWPGPTDGPVERGPESCVRAGLAGVRLVVQRAGRPDDAPRARLVATAGQAHWRGRQGFLLEMSYAASRDAATAPATTSASTTTTHFTGWTLVTSSATGGGRHKDFRASRRTPPVTRAARPADGLRRQLLQRSAAPASYDRQLRRRGRLDNWRRPTQGFLLEMSYAASHTGCRPRPVVRRQSRPGRPPGDRAQAGGMLALRSKKLVGSQTVLVARSRSHCVGL